MDEIARLQEWYRSQCNDDWEHTYGVRLDSLDNPGWWIKVDLIGTGLEGRSFPEITRGDLQGKGDWLACKVVDGKFDGAGGSHNLAEILRVFLDWADEGR